jgi:hypothetical protein
LNPFAPPQADAYAAPTGTGTGSFTVQGNILIAKKGTVLPNVCLFSGEAQGAERVHKKLFWAPPWTVIFVVSPLIFLIMYFIFRKSGELDYSLGPRAKQRRNQGILAGVGGVILGIVLVAAGGATNEPVLLFVGIFGLLIALVFGIVWGRIITIVRINPDDIHLKLRPEAAQVFSRLAMGG